MEAVEDAEGACHHSAASGRRFACGNTSGEVMPPPGLDQIGKGGRDWRVRCIAVPRNHPRTYRAGARIQPFFILPRVMSPSG